MEGATKCVQLSGTVDAHEEVDLGPKVDRRVGVTLRPSIRACQ
jgi:hypothetical protein